MKLFSHQQNERYIAFAWAPEETEERGGGKGGSTVINKKRKVNEWSGNIYTEVGGPS